MDHFAVPFRYVRGAAQTNTQGSPDDIAACVYAICATEPGQFLDLPDFGLPDPTFSQEPITSRQLLGPLSIWEDRAAYLAQIAPSKFDAAIVNANIQIEVGP